jgi:drug/metabolite transporter (DMT)-like permease
LLLSKSWVALADPIALSVEAVSVGLLYNVLNIPTLTIAATAIPIAGAMLLLINIFVLKQKITIFSDGWKYLLVGSLFYAIAEFAWYDSVSRIGAGKSVLLSLPTETVFIVVLAWTFLSERLRKLQIMGSAIAIIGFFLSAGSDSKSSSIFASFSLGDIEAVLSALSASIAITLYTKLLARYRSIEVTGFSLLIDGMLLNVLQWLCYPPHLTIFSWPYLVLFSFSPLFSVLLYNISLSRIGASITSIITSSSMVLTIIIQVILLEFGIMSNLPQNIFLAMIGGLVSLFGIYLIYTH